MALKLASGSYDGTIKFWDPSTGGNNCNEEIKLTKLNLIPNRIEVSETKLKLIVGMCNTCKIYDLNKPDTVEHSFDGIFKGNVTSVGFRKHDKVIYTACEDGALRMFDLRKKGQIRTLKQ
jgi:WD40 repeat protein